MPKALTWPPKSPDPNPVMHSLDVPEWMKKMPACSTPQAPLPSEGPGPCLTGQSCSSNMRGTNTVLSMLSMLGPNSVVSLKGYFHIHTNTDLVILLEVQSSWYELFIICFVIAMVEHKDNMKYCI